MKEVYRFGEPFIPLLKISILILDEDQKILTIVPYLPKKQGVPLEQSLRFLEARPFDLERIGNFQLNSALLGGATAVVRNRCLIGNGAQDHIGRL